MAKSKSLVKVPDELVMNKIYFIREQKVMLDSDLAELYGVETKRLKKLSEETNPVFLRILCSN